MKKLTIPAVRVTTMNGRRSIKIPDQFRNAYESMLAYCEDRKGGYVSITLMPPRKPRTTGDGSQNHHLNGHLQQIAQFTGEDFDEVKRHVKRQAIKRGYPMRTNRFGEAVPINEADASTVECGYLIDEAHAVADFLDLKLKEE